MNGHRNDDGDDDRFDRGMELSGNASLRVTEHQAPVRLMWYRLLNQSEKEKREIFKRVNDTVPVNYDHL